MKLFFWWNVLDIARTSLKGIQNFTAPYCTMYKTAEPDYILPLMYALAILRERHTTPTVDKHDLITAHPSLVRSTYARATTSSNSTPAHAISQHSVHTLDI